MTPSSLFDLFRKEVADEADPPLWTDDEVWDYMDDAQKEFCRRAWGISDSRSPLTLLTVEAGDIWLELDQGILRIRFAQRVSDFRDLTVVSFEQLQTGSWHEDDYGVNQRITLDDRTGPLKYLITGMDQYAVRLSPIPEEDDEIRLTVDRLPTTIDADAVANDSVTLEIPEQQHRGLLLWMKHRAYSKQDAETFDKGKAAEFAASFTGFCERARNEKERLEQRPGAIAYGGI